MDVKHELLKLAQIGTIDAFKQFVSGHFNDTSWCKVSNKKSGDTVLTLSARNGNLGLLKHLSEAYSLDLEFANLDGKRPLHEAAQNGHVTCVAYLLSKRVHVDSLKRADWTPLMLACTKSNLEVIKELVNSKADLNLRNKDGWNCFHIACRTGEPGILNYLLDCDSLLWKTVSNNGRTPLHTAALHGNLRTVEVLLERAGYSADEADSCGTTPFMDAIRAGHTEVADLLCEKHKASLKAVDKLGRQPIHLAAQAGCLQSVLYLVEEHKIDVNVQSTVSGVTPLHLASKEGQKDTIHLLVSLGALVDIKDSKGRTALHLASGSQHLDCVTSLYSHGARDCEDNSGNTAISLARKESIRDFLLDIT